jgi:hypothetical protein
MRKNILIRLDEDKQKDLIKKINDKCSRLNISASSLVMIALDRYLNERNN